MRALIRSRIILYFGIALLCSSSGCEPRNPHRPLATAATLEVHLISATNAPTSREEVDPISGSAIYLTSPPVITAGDVATVHRSYDSQQELSLVVNLTAAGSKRLADATTPATGQKVGFIADGKLIAVAEVREPLQDGSFQLTGGPRQKWEQLFEKLTKN